MIHALKLGFCRFHKLAFHALRIRFSLYFLGVKYNIFHVKFITTRSAQLPTFLLNANQETDNNIFFDVSANLSVIQIHLKRLFKVAPCFRQPFFSPLKDKNLEVDDTVEASKFSIHVEVERNSSPSSSPNPDYIWK